MVLTATWPPLSAPSSSHIPACLPTCPTRILRIVLDSVYFIDFFDQVEVANFEVASDAFSSFKVRE